MSSGSSLVSSLMPDLQRGTWMNLFSWGIAYRSHNAPEFESLSDTKDKLETRRKDVLSRSNRRLFLFLTYCNNNKVCVSSVDYYQLKKLST
ncbi:unnamed protein product [Brassica rapa subsp. narinosa]